MRYPCILFSAASLALCVSARAVYAPIPEQEQGKLLTVSLESGISYNTNIFGAAVDPIASTVFEVSPKITLNSSLSDTTFVTADAQPILDYFDNRPGSKWLYSQNVDGHLAHAFSPTSKLEVSDSYSYDQNPQALLNGTPINTNQTLQSDEFDLRYTYSPVERLGLVFKERTVYYDYIDQVLGDELNRFENLYGLEVNYALLPELKLAAEYRHQDIDYSTDPSNNDKHTDFLMAGLDYNFAPKLSLSFRVGGEHRHRDGLDDTTTPYAELSVKYDYAKGSFVSAGYSYSLEETSDPIHFTDEKVNRMFVNVQHSFTAKIVGSASIDYEPATLEGRPTFYNISEDTTHAGAAVSYLPNRNWTVTLSYDYDFVDSGLYYRGLNRSRTGLSATVVF